MAAHISRRRMLSLLCGASLTGRAAESLGQPPRAAPRRPRPRPESLRLEEVSPELEQILLDWEAASSRVQTLTGRFRQSVFEYTFAGETRTQGVFYYEAPNKGRIDFEPEPRDRGSTRMRRHWKTGRQVTMTIAPGPAKKWICDGSHVVVVDVEQKQVERFAIPPEYDGERIVDSPLPFLLGLPAEKAKRRFALKLLSVTAGEVQIEARPRWQQDASEYQRARITLDRRTWLASEVQLINPGDTQETVFAFSHFVANRKPNFFDIFRGDPFRPRLSGFRIVDRTAKLPTMPSVVGMPWRDAEKQLKPTGCHLMFLKGPPAGRAELTYCVSAQQPAPQTPLAPGQQVVLTVFLPPARDARTR